MDGSYSALVEETGKLIGFFCTGSSAQVPIGNEAGAYNEPRLDIGIGMNPELTGKGNGFRFFSQILELAKEEGNGLQFRLTVAAFNERAIHLYEKLGFVKEREFSTNSTKFITMFKGDI
ncbi:GNAT family N-acetyltransferase [Planomicrobium sp. CPCC 101079]|uniref:GNAT family N-acetyltransferase n=1 Tax=Planomicrobium sp. CPCC 101079 TaxID=2599618 RepID=UPI00351A4139